MGKILSGVLGNVSGKIAGVVGASWKGTGYLRAYAKPGNPNTGPQQVQRTAMRIAVAAAKPFVAPVFNAYYDRFVKGMSGFNRFVKSNIKSITVGGLIELPIVTSGPLQVAQVTVATYNPTTGVVIITWDGSHGVDGLDTDPIISWARIPSTSIVQFAAGALTRNILGSALTIQAGLTAADVEVGAFAVQFKPNSPTIVAKISNSSSMVCS